MNKERLKNDRLYKCDNRVTDGDDDEHEGFSFIPTEVGQIGGSNPQTITYSNGLCFQSLTFSYAFTGNQNDIGDVIITVDAEKPKSLLCNDWFLFGNSEVQHAESFYFEGKH